MLNREVDDLEQWFAEREVVAGSHELGQVMIQKNKDFYADHEET